MCVYSEAMVHLRIFLVKKLFFYCCQTTWLPDYIILQNNPTVQVLNIVVLVFVFTSWQSQDNSTLMAKSHFLPSPAPGALNTWRQPSSEALLLCCTPLLHLSQYVLLNTCASKLNSWFDVQPSFPPTGCSPGSFPKPVTLLPAVSGERRQPCARANRNIRMAAAAVNTKACLGHLFSSPHPSFGTPMHFLFTLFMWQVYTPASHCLACFLHFWRDDGRPAGENEWWRGGMNTQHDFSFSDFIFRLGTVRELPLSPRCLVTWASFFVLPF